MPQEKVREFLMDREDWRFIRIIIALLCMGTMIICFPFVCVKVKMPKWKPKVMSGSVANVDAIALLVNVKKVIGNQLVIDLQARVA